jgi:NADPH2 dehydrogenase
MASKPIVRIGAMKDVAMFRAHLASNGIAIPCDVDLATGAASPLSEPMRAGSFTIGNRWCIHPMEGWDGTEDGHPSADTFRRWRRFGQSGAKLIWGGEAVAVQHDGRANPNQLMLNEKTLGDIAKLREELIEEHTRVMGDAKGLVVGLQLTHSGRYSKPNDKKKLEPKIAFRHPILDKRLGLGPDYPLLSDSDLRRIIQSTVNCAKMAREIGYDFVDVKHCHGYLGHELLGAHTRDGQFGGSFENRTRYLREIVAGVRAEAPGLQIGVRVSIMDFVPFKPDPALSVPGKLGPGIPEAFEDCLPYRYGFGVNPNHPLEYDLTEPVKFLELLQSLGIFLVNLSVGSPYYNPHIQRPALYPPSDGYQPPEDPLVGVARQMHVVKTIKQQFPQLAIVGSGYTYLQDYFPHVAQAAVREGWTDFVGLGRMVLSYPELPADIMQGNPLRTKMICRTFSDCTTAPRNGLPSGCYPLDDHYADSETAVQLKVMKKAKK